MPSAPRPQPPRATAGREAGREAVEHLASALSEAGLPPLAARVWAALLSDSDGRMTAVELTEALQVSAAGVSGAVKYLVQVGWVRREREPGGRKDVYVAMDDVWHSLLLRSDQVYGPIIRALDEGVAAAPDAQARKRLAESREFLVFVGEEMAGMARRWEARKRERAPRHTEGGRRSR